ncbi:MAG TPA: hypothetical protein VJ001_17370 [Rhodocyclaceae bacterium]|nr:hypothetical protein [Rhodocyclaceae bacterium]
MGDFIVIALGRIGVLIAGVTAMKLLTTFFSPEEIAAQNQLLAISNLLASGLLAPLIVYFARGLIEWRAAGVLPEQASVLVRRLIALSLPLAALGAAVNLHWYLVKGISPTWVFGLLWLYLLAFPLNFLFANFVGILAQRPRSALYSGAAAWAGLGLALLLFFRIERIDGWILGTHLGLLATLPALMIVIRSQARSAGDPPAHFLDMSFGAIYRFCWPQVVVYALWWLQSQSYRFMLPSLADQQSVGLFFVAYALCSVPMQAFESALGELCTPRLYRDAGNRGGQAAVLAWQSYVSVYAPAILLFGGFLSLALPIAGKILIGERFHGVLSLLFAPVLTEMARALCSTMHAMGLAQVDMRVNLPVVALGAALSVATLPLYVAIYPPVIATACSLLTAGVGALAVVVYLTCVRYRAVWPLRNMVLALLLGAPLFLAGAFWAERLAQNWLHALMALIVAGGYFLAAMACFIKRTT